MTQESPSRKARFLNDLKDLVLTETAVQRQQVHTHWEKPLASRVADGYAIDGVALQEIRDDELVALICSRNISRFRPGAILCLTRNDTLRHQTFAKNQDMFLEHRHVQHAGRADRSPELDLNSFLEECLNRLPEQQRKLLEHKYTLAESSREIADSFGQSDTWVRTTLCRVRTALRQCIENKINGSSELA